MSEGMSRRYRLFREMVTLLLGRVLFGFVVHGEENAPGRGPLIVASNHSRYIDPVLVCVVVPRRIQWMAKKEVFVPGLRGFFALIGAFPIDRKGSSRDTLRKALELLGRGWALGIFPEGTRRRDESVSGAAKSGAVRLAVRSGAPVLPVYLGKRPTPLGRLRGEKLHAYVGGEIHYDDESMRSGRDYREAAEDLLHTIYALPAEQQPAGRHE